MPALKRRSGSNIKRPAPSGYRQQPGNQGNRDICSISHIVKRTADREGGGAGPIQPLPLPSPKRRGATIAARGASRREYITTAPRRTIPVLSPLSASGRGG